MGIFRKKRMESLNALEKIQTKIKAYELAISVREKYEGENVDKKACDIYKWLTEDL